MKRKKLTIGLSLLLLSLSCTSTAYSIWQFVEKGGLVVEKNNFPLYMDDIFENYDFRVKDYSGDSEFQLLGGFNSNFYYHDGTSSQDELHSRPNPIFKTYDNADGTITYKLESLFISEPDAFIYVPYPKVFASDKSDKDYFHVSLPRGCFTIAGENHLSETVTLEIASGSDIYLDNVKDSSVKVVSGDIPNADTQFLKFKYPGCFNLSFTISGTTSNPTYTVSCSPVFPESSNNSYFIEIFDQNLTEYYTQTIKDENGGDVICINHSTPENAHLLYSATIAYDDIYTSSGVKTLNDVSFFDELESQTNVRFSDILKQYDVFDHVTKQQVTEDSEIYKNYVFYVQEKS